MALLRTTNFKFVSIHFKANIDESYVLHKMNKDLQRILECKHKWLDGFWLYIQRIAHTNEQNMDLDIFLVCMQDGQDIPGQLYIQVLVLKKIMQLQNHASRRKNLMYCTKCKKEGKKENLRGLQSVSGDPINPSGQVHSGS